MRTNTTQYSFIIAQTYPGEMSSIHSIVPYLDIVLTVYHIHNTTSSCMYTMRPSPHRLEAGAAGNQSNIISARYGGYPREGRRVSLIRADIRVVTRSRCAEELLEHEVLNVRTR